MSVKIIIYISKIVKKPVSRLLKNTNEIDIIKAAKLKPIKKNNKSTNGSKNINNYNGDMTGC